MKKIKGPNYRSGLWSIGGSFLSDSAVLLILGYYTAQGVTKLSKEYLIILGCILGAFFLADIVVSGLLFIQWVEYDENGISQRGLFGTIRSLKYNEITSYSTQSPALAKARSLGIYKGLLLNEHGEEKKPSPGYYRKNRQFVVFGKPEEIEALVAVLRRKNIPDKDQPLF